MLPLFRGTATSKQESFDDPYEWLSAFATKLEGDEIPYHRWYKAALGCLSIVDRDWFKSTIPKSEKWLLIHNRVNEPYINTIKQWEKVFEKPFLAHYETPAQTATVIRALMKTFQGPNETTQAYSDRFAAAVKRSRSSYANLWVIHAYLEGLKEKVRAVVDNEATRQEKPHSDLAVVMKLAVSFDPAHQRVPVSRRGEDDLVERLRQRIRVNREQNARPLPVIPAPYQSHVTPARVPTPRVEPRPPNYCKVCQKDGKGNVLWYHTHFQTVHEGRTPAAGSSGPGPSTLNNWSNQSSSSMAEAESHAAANELNSWDSYGASTQDLDYEIHQFLSEFPQINNMDEFAENKEQDLQCFSQFRVNGQLTNGLIDTGANTTFIDKGFVALLGLTPKVSSSQTYRGGKPEPSLGTVTAEVSCGSRKHTITMVVIDHGIHNLLIGRRHFPLFGFRLVGLPALPPSGPRERPEPMFPKEDTVPATDGQPLHPLIAAALERNAAIDPLSFCTHPLAFLDMDTTQPVTHWSPRNFVKSGDEADVQECIDEWLKADVIEVAPKDSQTNFALLAVPKRDHDGNRTGTRVCTDLTPLNKYLLDDFYPIPHIFRILRSSAKCTGQQSRRSVIDLSAAYHRFLLRSRIVCFIWKGVQYAFTRAFFGVKVMPARFQRVIEAIMREIGLEDAAYFDDIFTSSNSIEEEVEQVVKVIDTLTRYNMIINQRKSVFCQSTVDGLGYTVDGSGIHVHASKVEAIKNWKPPKNGKEMRSFLGTANFNRKSMRHFAWHAAPLDRLRNHKAITWTDELDAAFNKIKEMVAAATVLVVEDPEKEVLLGTDASDDGLGFWRGQVKDEFKHVPSENLVMEQIDIIEFGSVAIPKDSSVKHGGATFRELRACMFAINKCLKNLWGRRFTLFTDHSALVWLFTKSPPNPMLFRWMDTLLSLDFQTVHWKGEDHIVADAMSRDSCLGMDTTTVLVQDASLNNVVHNVDEFVSIEGLVRDKKEPGGKEAKEKMVIDTHALGHFGSHQVFMRIWHAGYWWKDIRADIARILGRCLPCLRHTVIRSGYAPLQSVEATFPWDHLAIDLITALQVSKEGHTHILVILDISTRFVLLYALKDKTAATITRHLWHAFCSFGLPKILQSDNGKEFVNKVLKALLSLNGTDHRLIASYHPRANGAVERSNKDVEAILKKLLDGALDTWCDHLPWVQLCMNTRICSRHGSTPFSLMFGRHPSGLSDYRSNDLASAFNAPEWERHLKVLQQVVYPAIREKVTKARQSAAASFNSSHKIVPSFPPGSYVMAKDVVNDSKWHAVSEGPFKVRRKNQGGAYELEGLDGAVLPYKFPPEQLQLVPNFTAPEIQSLVVRNIQDHRGLNQSREYLVQWMDPAVPAQWLPPSSFDGTAMISKYLKSRALKEKRYRAATQVLKNTAPTPRPARRPLHMLPLSGPSEPTDTLRTATAPPLAASSSNLAPQTASTPALATTASPATATTPALVPSASSNPHTLAEASGAVPLPSPLGSSFSSTSCVVPRESVDAVPRVKRVRFKLNFAQPKETNQNLAGGDVMLSPGQSPSGTSTPNATTTRGLSHVSGRKRRAPAAYPE